jgi:16S rRNA (cytosine967-C5)-methyltransferase
MARRKDSSRVDPLAAEVFSLAGELYTTVRSERKPADYLIGEFFRRRRIRSHSVRGSVAGLVYAALRRAIAYERLLGDTDRVAGVLLLAAIESGEFDRKTAVAAMASVAAIPARQLESLADRAAADRAAPDDDADSIEVFAARHAFPAWVAAELEPTRPRSEIAALFDGLNARPPLAVRVNTWRVSVDEAAEALRREGFSVRAGAVSPHALLLGRERDLFATDAFREGLVEVQDEGSQLVSLVADPRPGGRVLDLCAGSGGKTLHLGALMRGRGEVFAYDTDARRLANIDRRLRRSGLQNVRVLRDTERFAAFAEQRRGSLDLVLVDAPCSGLGTVRRAPDIKLRATPELVDAMVLKQREVLATAADFVRPGGRIVYATCSILPRENESAVSWLLDRRSELAQVACGPNGEQTITLAPHRTGADGFFIAAFERSA